MVMGEIVPGVAVLAIVLADRTPLPLAEVGSPFLPGDVCLARVVQPLLLGDILHGVHFFGLHNYFLASTTRRARPPRARGGMVQALPGRSRPRLLSSERHGGSSSLGRSCRHSGYC